MLLVLLSCFGDCIDFCHVSQFEFIYVEFDNSIWYMGSFESIHVHQTEFTLLRSQFMNHWTMFKVYVYRYYKKRVIHLLKIWSYGEHDSVKQGSFDFSLLHEFEIMVNLCDNWRTPVSFKLSIKISHDQTTHFLRV